MMTEAGAAGRGISPCLCPGSLPRKRSRRGLHREVERKERRARGSFHLVPKFAGVYGYFY